MFNFVVLCTTLCTLTHAVPLQPQLHAYSSKLVTESQAQYVMDADKSMAPAISPPFLKLFFKKGAAGAGSDVADTNGGDNKDFTGAESEIQSHITQHPRPLTQPRFVVNGKGNRPPELRKSFNPKRHRARNLFNTMPPSPENKIEEVKEPEEIDMIKLLPVMSYPSSVLIESVMNLPKEVKFRLLETLFGAFGKGKG